MAFLPMQKTKALEVFGSRWSVDHDGRRISEGLGHGSHPFHFGLLHNTLDEAIDLELVTRGLDRDAYDVVALPDTLRMPYRTPIPGGRRHEDDKPPSRAWILFTNDILNLGIRIEERRVIKVGFRSASPDIADVCDVAANWVVVEGEPPMRIEVEYDKKGKITSEDFPRIASSDGDEGGFKAFQSGRAFFSFTEAREAANAFKARLLAAADWEENSSLDRETGLSLAA